MERGLIPYQEIEALSARLREYSHEKMMPMSGEFSVDIEPKAKRGDIKVTNYGDAIRKFHNMHANDDLFSALVFKQEVVNIVATLIGYAVKESGSIPLKPIRVGTFMKPPGIGAIKGLHQEFYDVPAVTCGEMVGCWIAIDDSTLENGCLRIIPGLHTKIYEHHVRKGYRELRPEFYTHEDIKPIEMKSGDALFFNSMMPHCSGPNRSDVPRRANSTFYVRASRFYFLRGEIGNAEITHKQEVAK